MNGPLFRNQPNAGATASSEMDEQTKLAIKSVRVKMFHELTGPIQTIMESCPAKTVMSGIMGFALGGVFGLFMASMHYDTPIQTSTNAATTMSLPIKQQIKAGFKDMGSRSLSSAKNFGKVGAIFAGTECCIEGFRAKNDLVNGVIAGCITGGALAAPAGPQATAVGCVGFAAFSAAIDAYMRRPSDTD